MALFTRLLLITLIALSKYICSAQNLEAIGKSKPIKVNGGLSANQIFYAADGIGNRRSPYSYFLNGNLNLSFYEFNVPLSFNFSNQNISFQQPFNQLSLHPVYKWITGHIGFVGMTFSPYTLSGHIFKGIGVDVAPSSKIKISAMYGRLLRAVLPDTVNNQTQPSFVRYGYGAKVSYNVNGNFLDLIAFRAKDDVYSLPYVPEEQNVLPQENLVLSAAGGLTIARKFQVKYEFSNSAISSDTRADEINSNNLYDNVGPLFTPRISTSFFNAMKGSINYNGGGFAVGAAYERIDPQYKTLGAYFFNNDLENITVNVARSFFSGKVNLAASVGTQRDNLDNTKISTLRRTISSATIAFVPDQNLTINCSYSNFQTYTNIRSPFVTINQLTPYDNLDTLSYTQLSQNANAAVNYQLKGSKEKRKNIFLTVNFMKAADNQSMVSQNSGSIFSNFNAGYNLNLSSKDLSITTTLNASHNKSLLTGSVMLGPSLSVSKTAFAKKLRVTASGNVNRTYTESKFTSQVTSVRTMFAYAIKKKNNFNLSLIGLSRNTSNNGVHVKLKEFTGTLGYSYSF